jgi:hypothetical protein
MRVVFMTVTHDDSANGAAATRIARSLLRAKEDFTFPFYSPL